MQSSLVHINRYPERGAAPLHPPLNKDGGNIRLSCWEMKRHSTWLLGRAACISCAAERGRPAFEFIDL